MSCPTNRTILDSSNIKQITHATYECKVIGYVLIDAKIRNMIGRKRSPINSGSTVRLSNYFEARPLAVKLVKQINTGSPFWYQIHNICVNFRGPYHIRNARLTLRNPVITADVGETTCSC